MGFKKVNKYNNGQNMVCNIKQVISWDSLGISEEHKTGLNAVDYVIWLWLRFLVNSKASKDTEMYITSPTNASQINRILGIPIPTIHNAIQRLRNKGYIATERIFKPGNLVIKLLKLPETHNGKTGYGTIDIESFIKMVKKIKNCYDVKVLIATWIHYSKNYNRVDRIRKCFMRNALGTYGTRIHQIYKKLTKMGYFKVDAKGLITEVKEVAFYNSCSYVSMDDILSLGLEKEEVKTNKRLSTTKCKMVEEKLEGITDLFKMNVKRAYSALKVLRDKAFKKYSMNWMLKFLQHALTVPYTRLDTIIEGYFKIPGGKDYNPYYILCVK